MAERDAFVHSAFNIQPFSISSIAPVISSGVGY
jgi:hypothetical protein